MSDNDAAREFRREWQEWVKNRSLRRWAYPSRPRRKKNYGYVYLMQDGQGHLKVGFTSRRSDYKVGRIAQHLDQGWSTVQVARFESASTAKDVEQTVLWLWSKHKLRRRLDPAAMPQGGYTEVAVHNAEAIDLYTRAVTITRRGGDARFELAPPGAKLVPKQSPRLDIEKLVGSLVVGLEYHPESHAVVRQGSLTIDGWLFREPTNKHDRNAIAVYWSGGQLGYISAVIAERLAPQMDQARCFRISVELQIEPAQTATVWVKRILNSNSAGNEA
jgi:hypothetical protein